MSNGKIGFELGDLKFSGEGTEAWLAEQLGTVIAAIPELRKSVPARSGSEGQQPGRTGSDTLDSGDFTDTLAGYIRDNGGSTKQVRRFLVTADWLRRKGVTPLTTTAVTKALSDNQQKGLSNASDCLNQLVGQGLCEKKEGNSFFITPDGIASLTAKS